MKITAIAVLGLSLFGSIEGSLYAPKPKGTVLRSFGSTQMGTSGNAVVASEALEVSNFHRKLGITYKDNCNLEERDAPDRCCYGIYNDYCKQSSFTRDDFEFVVPKGSCIGHGVCQDVGLFYLGEKSCKEKMACWKAAGNAIPDLRKGLAIVASNSCHGKYACHSIGELGGEATIGSNSCLGEMACYKAGRYGKATIGDDSCQPWFACNGMAHKLNADCEKCESTVGKKSCNGKGACKGSGRLGSGQGVRGRTESVVTIGDESCNAEQACADLNYRTDNGNNEVVPDSEVNDPIVIGKGSCNCKHCCMCLTHGDIVPDGKCNTRGSGANQCCTAAHNGYRNTNFDYRNLAKDPVTGPTAPTRPESYVPPATAYAAPAEFDVTLTTSPGCEFTGGTDKIGTITCTFDTKGGELYTVDSELYNADCSSSTTGVPQGVSRDAQSIVFNRALVSGKQYESAYAVSLPIANSAAAGGSTDIAFCLKTEVKDKNGDVYDWTGQKIKLAVNVDGSFTTDSLSTQTFDGDAAAQQDVGASSFGVSIDRCDENGGVISGGSNDVLSVGDNFYLCVKGKQSQVIVSNIGEMTATKTDIATPLSLVAATSTGSEGTVNSNTFVYGNGGNQVVIATRLPATFFETGGTVTFAGSANINVGRRWLSRSMQASEAEESGNFSIDIQVAGMDDASSASAIRGTAAMFFAAVVAALIV